MITTEKAITTLLAESACVRRRRSTVGCHRDCIKCDLGLQGEEILEAIQMAGLVLDMKARSIPMRLKTCPFCGAEGILLKNCYGKFNVRCSNPACGAVVWGCDGTNIEEDVIAAWNRRPV